MPAQPVATVTSPEALTSLPAPLPHAVPPAVTDPVSNLDFPPVDDAFALEMRAETIEQLAGGDALRRGASERIEAGRSQANADLVAGRDRVRVHGTLHEHTGHGLAEQAAHLHTTVDGVLDVHAASEDTVLLAGHMRDLWDGGATIVAAMTDDTVAGGGIRVTTPLDLWVHGLMGVEERIGTCAADAVLLELGATHYEREYGPGAHTAGLAVYTGSLYQSSRSTFRPLMRVSSGVRNLIAGGNGGGGGGDGGGGGGGGAGGAPGASPPPAAAQSGAAAKSVTRALAAGRRAAAAPATALDSADALTGARRLPLDELVDAIDARAAEDMGEAGAVMRARDLPELTRCADTAERLGALGETLRIDAMAAGSETAGGFRASEFEGAVSMHPAGGGGGPLEITPPAAAQGENASMVRPHPGVPWGKEPEMKLGLLGGADRPPQSAAPETDFLATYRRLRELRDRYDSLSRDDITRDFQRPFARASRRILRHFEKFGGNMGKLVKRRRGTTRAEQAYGALREMARQADNDGDLEQAGAIREGLDTISKQTVEGLNVLLTRYGMAETTPTQAMQRPPGAAEPTATGAAIPPPAHTTNQADWITAYRQLLDLVVRFVAIRWDIAHLEFQDTAHRMSRAVMHRFRNLGGNSEHVLVRPTGVTKAEQAYRAIEDMSRRATESGDARRAGAIDRALNAINAFSEEVLNKLTTKYGALDALSARTMHAPPVTGAPPVAGPSTTVPPVERLDIPGPEHRIVPGVDRAFPEPAGRLVHTTDVPGPPPASSLPGPPLSEAAGARAGDLGRGRLDPPAAVSGTTAAQPAATEATVTPSLGETSSFWLQPVDPVPAPGTVAFDSGVQRTGETVQPPPVTTTAGSTAPAPGAAYHVPSWVDDDFAVERALLARKLPPRFDTSLLIVEARLFEQFGLAEELAAGRLPGRTIDVLIEGFRATDEGGSNALFIDDLHALKESIERALRDAYPERVDPRWLDQVRDLLRRRGEPAPPSAASTTSLPEFDVKEIDRLLGTGEGVSHSAPLPRPSAAGRAGTGAGAPPPAAGQWRIRPQGMGGEPHPAAFDPWSAPPGPSSQVVYTEAIRTPVLSAGAPPGWQGAETPGFARAGSGDVELPFSRRGAIVHRFRTEDALLEAELALQTGSAEALGWPATRWRAVRADLYRLNAIVQADSAAAAAMLDIDWSAIEALGLILDALPHSP